ncbi:GAF domain-containing sensor histidine kinase [Fictibacillus aquaticus]|nr:GAF domain-containing sensor histidine kinase [Fictibacillus aquaticus]
MAEAMNTNEINTLKVIAETLNQSHELRPMLQSVLEKLLEITKLQTGWIFLVDEEPIYHFVADCHLPPALAIDNKRPMCENSCWCLDKYWDGRLNSAVNIINCKRIEDAIECNWGDTGGLTHHATVPIAAGGEKFGVLNIGSPGKVHFEENELNLLQSVALQIGTAIKRTKLYGEQQERANTLEQLDDFGRYVWKIQNVNDFPEKVVKKIAGLFHWSQVAFMIKEEKAMTLHTTFTNGAVKKIKKRFSLGIVEELRNKSLDDEELIQDLEKEGFIDDCTIAVSLTMGEEILGALIVCNERKPDSYKECDKKTLKAIADYVALAVQNAVLNEKSRELALAEERNRLARDLHDSVNQKLFSLSLTAKGLKAFAPKENEIMQESLDEIQNISQEVLQEMRALIWQLRPAGLEEGIGATLEKYGKSLGIQVDVKISSCCHMPRVIEEALWRIGQEALNNISKHAKTDKAELTLEYVDDTISMKIRDYGEGFQYDENVFGRYSLGLTSMRERTCMLGGKWEIDSRPGCGTELSVKFNLKGDSLDGKTASKERGGDAF